MSVILRTYNIIMYEYTHPSSLLVSAQLYVFYNAYSMNLHVLPPIYLSVHYPILVGYRHIYTLVPAKHMGLTLHGLIETRYPIVDVRLYNNVNKII